MRIFYAIWFFVCILWGHLMAEPVPEVATPASASPAVFVAGLVSFFALLVFEAWRRPPDNKPSRPSINLRPWDEPTGMFIFIFTTFLFSACWGMGIALLLPLKSIDMPAFVLALSAGALVGIHVAYRVFPHQFRA